MVSNTLNGLNDILPKKTSSTYDERFHNVMSLNNRFSFMFSFDEMFSTGEVIYFHEWKFENAVDNNEEKYTKLYFLQCPLGEENMSQQFVRYTLTF